MGDGQAVVAPEMALSKRRAIASASTEFLIPRQNIGIQLYSVRDRADADLPGTLAMLADGDTEVEPFSYMDRAADGSFADLGTGTIDSARIFSTLENQHYHHYLVERDTLPDSQHTAEVGYEYLRTLRARRARKAGH